MFELLAEKLGRPAGFFLATPAILGVATATIPIVFLVGEDLGADRTRVAYACTVQGTLRGSRVKVGGRIGNTTGQTIAAIEGNPPPGMGQVFPLR